MTERTPPNTGTLYGEGTIDGREAYRAMDEKPCPIAYASGSRNPDHVSCSHEKGHGQVGPEGKNQTRFDHGNDAAKLWWNNDSRFLVIDHDKI